MKKKFLFTIVLMLQILTVFSACDDSSSSQSEIEFTQSANSSSGSYWEYELSTDNVLIETEYYTSKFPLNLGSGYKQHWTFEIINSGEVTIEWLAYEGDSYKESASYSMTYVFDDNGNYHIKSNEMS